MRVALSCYEYKFKQVLRRIYDIYFPSKFRALVLGTYKIKFLSNASTKTGCQNTHYSLTNIEDENSTPQNFDRRIISAEYHTIRVT
jgi:hypothetical protein